MSVNELVMIIVLVVLIVLTNYIVLRNVWEWWIGLESDKDK